VSFKTSMGDTGFLKNTEAAQQKGSQ